MSHSSMGICKEVVLALAVAVTLGLMNPVPCCASGTGTPVQAQGPDGGSAAAGRDLSILQSFIGDYPVAELHRLPPGQEKGQAGFLGSREDFAPVWESMFPSQAVPDIDFTKNIVLFFRNVHFYNRTSISRVVVKDGVVDILARETMSALPIEDKVAMSLAVVPREGVKSIRTGTGLITVAGAVLAGPLYAAYTIEGGEVILFQGRAEEAAVPGSAVKITTMAFSEPVQGDLDNDGRDDEALILARSTGGSGVFYYVAACLKENGSCRGTNAVLLGDRIAPKDMRIHKGVVVVNYAARRPSEAMTVPPSLGMTKYLKIEKGTLEEIEPLEMQAPEKGAGFFLPICSLSAEMPAAPGAMPISAHAPILYIVSDFKPLG